ncbi:DUF721 domain-containing protein [Candidatus Protofrankia californiensis]|uniref:DUF721 domain-containing protein n=1 Tax=Candidatus Protofrankia californiensis TaxID=1839754 RepID=UPI001F493772|nr:DciA family protein [Candidatus Protofrankia californiensis]
MSDDAVADGEPAAGGRGSATGGRGPVSGGHQPLPGGRGQPPGDEPVRGADLARIILARAKEDARARASGRGGGRAGNGSGVGRRDGSVGPAGGGGGRPDPSRQPARRPRMPGMAAPGREWAEPVALSTAVQRMLAERGWRDRATDASVLARWEVLVGPNISTRCHPVSLRDGELELAAESTAWATQLRLLSRQILTTLRAELGPDVVRRIVVRGPTAPSWRHGPLQAPGGRGPRDTYG